jgi:hypothetical protein
MWNEWKILVHVHVYEDPNISFQRRLSVQVKWYIYNMVMNWILLVSWSVKIGTIFAIRIIRYRHLISFIQNCQFWPFSTTTGRARYFTNLVQFEYSCHTITTESLHTIWLVNQNWIDSEFSTSWQTINTPNHLWISSN